MKKIALLLFVLVAVAAAKQYEIYNPAITRGYMYPKGDLLYNHDSSIEYFQGRFYGAWNGNSNPREGAKGQKNYWAVSDDGLNWSKEIAYTNVPMFGHPDWQTEWQPNMLNWKDEELWSLWTKAGGFVFSRLNADKTGWDHRLVWNQYHDIKGKPFHTFPTQETTVLDDGSVLIPTVFREPAEFNTNYNERVYYSGPIITRDGGKTFYVAEDALVEHPWKDKDPVYKLWEPMYVVQADGRVRMFNRTLTRGISDDKMPDQALVTAVGSADGETMGEPEFSAIRTIHSRMWLGYYGERRLLIHHDSMKGMNPRDRINIALFSSRTGRDDFVAGIPIECEVRGIAYPQAVIVSNAAYVCYSHQAPPATIMVNKVEPLPADDRWYIFPRSGNRSLSGNDQPRVVKATKNDPAHLEFYASAYDVKAGPPNTIGKGSVTITGWYSMRPKNDGVVFNALSDDGQRGFSLRFNKDNAFIINLGGGRKGKELKLATPMRQAGIEYENDWDYTPWTYFALTIDNENGKVYYWFENERRTFSKSFEPGRDISSGTIPGFGMPMPQSRVANHYPLYARMQSVRVYDKVLSEAEMRYDYNRFPGRQEQGDAAAPPAPVWKLDLESYDDRFLCVKNKRPVAMPVGIGKRYLEFRGNSAAGVDLEKFEPETDEVEVTLPVQMDAAPVSESVVLMSMGDNNDIMIGLRRDDPAHVYVNCTGTWEKACAFKIGERNKLQVRMDKQAVTVANGSDSVTVPNNGISQRLYLGDGYPNFYVSPEDRFVVDTASFDANVVLNFNRE